MERKRRKRDALWNKTSGDLHELKLMLGIPTTPQDRRGLEAEDKAEKALTCLREKGLIAQYIRTIRFSPDDLDGKDFIITFLTGDSVAINVKNHRWSRQEKVYQKKGILLVTIWESDTDEIAREKIIDLLSLSSQERRSLPA